MYKYLGHGSYGCVIEPYIPCNNKKKKNKKVKYISKLFRYKDDWNDEIKNQMIIKKIDPKHKFTVELISYCDLNEKEFDIKKIKNYEKCNFSEINVTNNYQIIYEYGGIDLSKIFKLYPNIDVYNFMKSFTNIFNGIVVLDKKKYIHNDINIKNIIFNIDTYTCKLIDFGFLLKIKDLYKHENLNIIHQSYRYFPPEYNSIYIKNYTNLNNYLCIDFFYNYIKILKYKNHPYLNHIEKLYKDIISDIKNNYKVIINKKKQGGNEDKINVYMVGICLLEVLLLMLILIKGVEKPALPIEGICDLIKQMICTNPEKRILSKEALDIYKQLFNS